MKHLFTLLLVIVCTEVTIAQTVTYEFSGVISKITQNTNNAIPGVYLNQPFSGQVSYSQMPTNMYGDYNQKGNISFTLGGQTFSFVNDDLKLFLQDWPVSKPDKYDYFRIYTYSSQNGFYFGRTGLEFYDYTKNVFADNSLPMNLDMSKFSYNYFNIAGGLSPSSNDFNVQGTLTSLTLVPEPATLVLLGVGGLLFKIKSAKGSKNGKVSQG